MLCGQSRVFGSTRSSSLVKSNRGCSTQFVWHSTTSNTALQAIKVRKIMRSTSKQQNTERKEPLVHGHWSSGCHERK